MPSGKFRFVSITSVVAHVALSLRRWTVEKSRTGGCSIVCAVVRLTIGIPKRLLSRLMGG